MIQFEALTKQDILITIIAVSAFLILWIVFSSKKNTPMQKDNPPNITIRNKKKYHQETLQKHEEIQNYKEIKSDMLDNIILNNQKYNDKLYQRLKGMVLGDDSTAERLIRMEQGRIPSEPRINAIKRAIERLEMDRR